MNKYEECKEPMGHDHQAEQYLHYENTRRRKRKRQKNYLKTIAPNFPNLSKEMYIQI